MRTKSIVAALILATLAACTQNASEPGMTALDACKRADVKDKILTEIANAFVGKAGGLVTMFGGPEVFNAASEEFKSSATIENPRVADSPMAGQKVYEVHCTVDLATVNSAKDNTPVEFRNIEFAIHYNNGTTDLGTEDYYLIPYKASFFRTVFVNGMPQAEYLQQQSSVVTSTTGQMETGSDTPDSDVVQESGMTKTNATEDAVTEAGVEP